MTSRMCLLAAVIAVVLAGAVPPASVGAVADDLIERLATCQDSWLDWKDDPVAAKKFGDTFRASFTPKGNDGSWAPKSRTLILGVPLSLVYPQSVGMGVGFSVVVEASFDATRARVEKAIGKTLKDCDTSDGMRSCGLEISPKRTVMLTSGLSKQNSQALLGCYYYYEK